MESEAWRNHLRQGSLFLIVGLAQLALDTSVFIATTAIGTPIVAGNVLGRLSGACLGFWLNGRFTFGKENLDQQHALRFALVWSVLTILSTVSISIVATHLGLHGAWLAKPLVEGVFAIASFFLWKYVVYR
ncbi:MAG: GtrA family protein [Lysobacteraceae bacterium]